MKARYFLSVFVKVPGSIDSVKIIEDREIQATSYTKAYDKAVFLLTQNRFCLDHVFIVIDTLDF